MPHAVQNPPEHQSITRPHRSALYLPASRQTALEKARGLAADTILFDLEDAVAPDAKATARDQLCKALRQGGYGPRYRVVRINGLETAWGREDALALAALRREKCGPDAVLLPKVGAPRDLERVAELLPHLPVWAMIETARGVLAVAEIATHPAVEALVMGTNDLARELGCRDRPDRLPMMPSLGLALLAARAGGCIILDGVYNAFTDEKGFLSECEQGRDLGFDGKTVIHPAQIAAANRVFAPDQAEIALAERRIAAFEEALKLGQGVAVLDGRIVENLHVEMARSTLERAQAIAERG